MQSTLSMKGRVTIPKAIPDHLRLEPGGRIKFMLYPDGSVVILPKIAVSNLKGMVRSRRQVFSNEMEPAIFGSTSSRKKRIDP